MLEIGIEGPKVNNFFLILESGITLFNKVDTGKYKCIKVDANKIKPTINK